MISLLDASDVASTLVRDVTQAWTDVAVQLVLGPARSSDSWARPRLAPTPRHLLHCLGGEGRGLLYRFGNGAPRNAAPRRPILLVPSLINRWYVLDLRAGASLVEALVAAGFDTYCLDWGVPRDEDRYLTWDDVVERLGRAVRLVRRETGGGPIGLLGYCMGGTLSGIHAALHPESVAGLINLAGPFDFSQAGLLGTMTDARWFDAEAVAAAGNVSPSRMQAGFVALRPTAPLAKLVQQIDRAGDAQARQSQLALETWASDNIPFPAAAYTTYIGELYQQNRLISGQHQVRGKRVDLSRIVAPVMTIVADRDAICPVAAATALNRLCGGAQEVLNVPGGHVGAVVGSRASRTLYPALVRWLGEVLSA